MLLAEVLLVFTLKFIISVNFTLTSWLFHPTLLTQIKVCDSSLFQTKGFNPVVGPKIRLKMSYIF